jgi:hypothetical protein
VKTGQREVLQIVESTKRQSEDERKELDSQNLNLQSLLYGKDYYLKQVHFCKEFKTPLLAQCILPEEFAERFQNFQATISEGQHKANLVYLGNQLEERKLLSKRLSKVEEDRREKESEYLKRQRVLEEFPQTLDQLEKATHQI